jgi:hypothetical protein
MKSLTTNSLVLVALAAALLVASIGGALGFVSDTASVGGNSFDADTLNPPTSLTAGGGASITLNWTATTQT